MSDKGLSQYESPDESPGFLLWQVTNLWQRRIRAGLGEFDLTHVQFVLLASLAWMSQSEPVITQVSLASYAKTDVMMTSTVLRALEEKGLVRREPHPTDTRARSLHLTDAAWPLIHQAFQRVEQIDLDFFDVLGSRLLAFNQDLRRLLSKTP